MGTSRDMRTRGLVQLVADYKDAALETLAEICWPTRCVVCETPGKLICDDCALALPYIDAYQACPICGCPDSRQQCLFCNSFFMGKLGRTHPPFAQCRSAIMFQGRAAKLVTAYKDGGERRMARVLARLLRACMPPSWTKANCAPFPTPSAVRTRVALTYIPASKAAVRRRGFDHMELVCQELAQLTGLPLVRFFKPPLSQDQRALGKTQRHRNMQGALELIGNAYPENWDRIIVVDDVFTTGATMFAACDALLASATHTLANNSASQNESNMQITHITTRTTASKTTNRASRTSANALRRNDASVHLPEICCLTVARVP